MALRKHASPIRWTSWKLLSNTTSKSDSISSVRILLALEPIMQFFDAFYDFLLRNYTIIVFAIQTLQWIDCGNNDSNPPFVEHN